MAYRITAEYADGSLDTLSTEFKTKALAMKVAMRIASGTTIATRILVEKNEQTVIAYPVAA